MEALEAEFDTPNQKKKGITLFKIMAGADAAGASQDMFFLSFFLNGDRLQVGQEPPFGAIVRVAHVVPDPRTFTAKMTRACHNYPPG